MNPFGLAVALANALASVAQHSPHPPVTYEHVQSIKAGDVRRDHPPASDTDQGSGLGRRVHIHQLA